MQKTNAKVYFSLFGEEFPIETVSNALGLNPTHSHIKGEEIKRKSNHNVTYTRPLYRKETTWELGTEYEETTDLNEQISQVIEEFQNKEETINELCKTYKLECLFMIVLVINDGFTPATYINKEFINIANQIGAEIHFDIYANPYKSEFDE